MIKKVSANPKTILCLTFTDAAANKMQKKLSEKALYLQEQTKNLKNLHKYSKLREEL